MERKIRILEELARTVINENSLPKYFWVDAISTSCYVLNMILILHILNKTPYELFKGRKTNLSHLHVFGCKCVILNNGKDNLGKFDAKADKGIFLGYSQSSKAYRVYNNRLLTVEDSVHVTFDESYLRNVRKGIFFHDACVSSEDILKDTKKGIDQPKAVKPKEEEDDNSKKEKERMRVQLKWMIFLWLGGLPRTIQLITFLETSPKV